MAHHITSSIVALLSVVALTNCNREQSAGGSKAAAAPVTPATAPSTASSAGFGPGIADGSKHFSRVVGRLDVGGKMIQFQDHEGSREMFIEMAKAIIGLVPEGTLNGKIDCAGLVDASGLGQSAASGRSLRKDGDAWLLRSYSYLPSGKSGLSALLGAAAEKFRSPDVLPGTADFVIEARLDATSLPAMMQRIGKACGEEAKAKEVLNQALPIGDTLQGLLAKTNLHLILGVDLSSLKVPFTKAQPIDFFLRIEGGKDLWSGLLPELEKGLGKSSEFGTRRGWELPMPTETNLLHPKALLVYDTQGSVTFVSRQDYLQQVESSATKLATAKDFVAATKHFPKHGNLLVFASSRIPPAVAWAIRGLAASNVDADAMPLLVKATEFFAARPYSFCVACEPDGIATTSEIPFPMETNLTTTLPLLSATSIMFVGARAWKKGSDRAGCILNIRNVQQAVRSHANLNDLKIGDPLPMDDIFGKDKYINDIPRCPGGGTYTFLRSIPSIGALECECSQPDHKPANHKDW